jgi:hypothetical protein
MALGMVPSGAHPAASSPRLPQGQGHAQHRPYAPSAFRSPPLISPVGFESVPNVQPSRPAPPPPTGSSSRRDSGLPSSPAQGYSSGSTSRTGPTHTKSSHNSPNPNRFSAGAAPSSYHSPTMGMAPANSAPPPRPIRAGTMPLTDHKPSNGVAPGNEFRDPISPPIPSTRSPNMSATQSGFLPHPAPPPLHHQPFSAPTKPYVTQTLEKTLEEVKIGLGMGVPMNVVEPKEKELPKEPPAMGRNRSGTGKSLNNKKSVFGVLTGSCSVRAKPRAYLLQSCFQPIPKRPSFLRLMIRSISLMLDLTTTRGNVSVSPPAYTLAYPKTQIPACRRSGRKYWTRTALRGLSRRKILTRSVRMMVHSSATHRSPT